MTRQFARLAAALAVIESVQEEHQPVEDWVPTRAAFSGRELRAVYCSCGADDYAECPTAMLVRDVDTDLDKGECP
ncbi:hypothetical protein SEA_NANCYRAE_70 [Gordonia phage NancyRae]|uniref:Uncharacterized protein n=1 Tax=Gordonia phage NancyRae TaxID=2793698 RepID=A0A7T0M0X8_9CAUD|nr:hypothetical protein SEA_NANCYRAE_70 [Gordonia phage NancyRae]